MEWWINGIRVLQMDFKFQYSIIPTFHHSLK
jgi:hypothetical protein